jgi:PAS domain S-box-containing protein
MKDQQKKIEDLVQELDELRKRSSELENVIADDFRKINDELMKYMLMTNSSKDYITLIDNNYIYQAVNDAYLEARNLKREDVIGHSVSEIWGESVFQESIKPYIDKCLEGNIVNDQSTFEFRAAELNYMDVTYYPCYDMNGTLSHVVVTSHNITEIKRSEEKIKRLAYFDQLTGLPNRVHFMELLKFELNHAKRNKTKLAVMFLDLDNFKTINDTLGHDVGDKLLQGVAMRVAKLLRESDTVSRVEGYISLISDSFARIGGDEFLLIIPSLSFFENATVIVERILNSFKEPFFINGYELHITTSIGIALYPDDGGTIDTLLKNSDTAMYRAKEQGKNNYQFYTPSMTAEALDRMRLATNLYHALERNELDVYYQPLIDLNTGQIVGIESLLRWQHPELGQISPEKFIPVAEEAALIVPIGEMVLRKACKQMKTWEKSGLKSLCLSVNLSVLQIKDRNFIEKVSKILDETKFEPERLELEITETTILQSIDVIIDNLYKLKDMGVNIAIDDFGTGYSSLTSLKRLPINTLKIDQSFIQNITSNEDDATIVSIMIAMAHKMNIKVVAEGVETQEQLSLLKQFQCHEVQGYLVGYPLSAEEMTKLIQLQGNPD